MANLYRKIQDSEQSRALRQARQSRQAARRSQFANLRQALDSADNSNSYARFDEVHDPSTRRRAFDLRKNEGDERQLIAGLHPGDSALQLASEALSQYNIPAQIRLRYGGMDRKAGRAGHSISDGTIFIEAELKPVNGMKAYFTVPIMVRASKLLYPSVIVTSTGVPRVIAQSTFDELVGYIEMDQTVTTDRHPFDSPMPGPSNTRRSNVDRDAIRRAMRGLSVTAAPRMMSDEERSQLAQIRGTLEGLASYCLDNPQEVGATAQMLSRLAFLDPQKTAQVLAKFPYFCLDNAGERNKIARALLVNARRQASRLADSASHRQTIPAAPGKSTTEQRGKNMMRSAPPMEGESLRHNINESKSQLKHKDPRHVNVMDPSGSD